NHGEVQQFAAPDVVYNKPANLFVARFLGTPPMNTVRARLEAAGDALTAVIGGTARLPLPAQPAAARGFVGREVFLGVRPECINDRGSGAALEAEVQVSEPTGAETLLLLRVGNERLRARVAPDAKLAPGQSASFSVDTRTACLFDPAS